MPDIARRGDENRQPRTVFGGVDVAESEDGLVGKKRCGIKVTVMEIIRQTVEFVSLFTLRRATCRHQSQDAEEYEAEEGIIFRRHGIGEGKDVLLLKD